MEDADTDGEGTAEAVKKKSTSEPLNDKPLRKTPKEKREEEELQLLKVVANSLAPEESNDSNECIDCCSRFGEYVTETLRGMNERTRLLAVNNIHNAIFQAQMSVYSNTPVSYQPYPQGLAEDTQRSRRDALNFSQILNLQ